jgi:hypothetical protein
MSKPQLIFELPLDCFRSRQRLATPIYEAGDATEQYLASQILVGFTSFWKKALFIKFPVRTEKVYYLIEDLLTDVRILYDLHLETGGSKTEPIMSNNQGNASNRHNCAHTGGTQTFSGSKRQSSNISEESQYLSQWQMNNLPQHVLRGGSERSRGQGSNCVCTLCYKMGHTFEFCRHLNG